MTTKKSAKGKAATKPPPCSAFTVRANGVMPAVIFEVGISPSVGMGRMLAAESIRRYSAVWSTASNCSLISKRVVEELALEPNPKKKDGELCYAVEIHLPNKIRITVKEARIMDTSIVKDQAECLIGMDVISQGDISISHKDNKTFFSFRAPSLGGIDYAEEIESSKTPLGSTTMVRRNQMCPCGSGKRYKNCCGRLT